MSTSEIERGEAPSGARLPRRRPPRPEVLSGFLDDDSTRSRLLRGAAGVFARRSISSATVEDILRAAGISRRTFYAYFDSKDALLLALFDSATQMLVDRIKHAAAARGTAVERLSATIDVYLDLNILAGPLVATLQAEAARQGSALSTLREATLDAIVDFFSEEIAAEIGLRVDRLLLRGFLIALEGMIACEHRRGVFGPESAARVRGTILAMMQRTLQKPGDPLVDLPLEPGR